MSNKKITTLYEHYKNTPKKLKIVCDWDEVIQVHEPYAMWLAALEEKKLTKEYAPVKFEKNFEYFWHEEPKAKVEYSPYCSKLNVSIYGYEIIEKQQVIKNSPNFYQQAPFLTIAEDLLKLIKEDKVEQIIFLSAYDKRKFPNGDERKYEIFRETFAKLAYNWRVINTNQDWNDGIVGGELNRENGYLDRINLYLIGFASEEKGQTKAEWIKQNAADFDLVIDDNPNICRSLVELKQKKTVIRETDETKIELWKRNKMVEKVIEKDGIYNIHTREINPNIEIITPYYPAIENQHHSEVLLIKQEISNLKKEDFSK